MSLKKHILFLLSLYLFISCKKDKSSPPNNPNKLRLYIEDARATPTNAIDSFMVTYDGNNRIISLSSSNINFIYSYPSNSNFTLDLYTNNQLDIHEVLYVNSALLVDSTFQYNNTNDSTTEKYIYIGKLLTHKTTYKYSKLSGSRIDTQNDYNYDNNGNPIRDTQTDSLGNINTIFTYTYNSSILNFSTSPLYFASKSKNLPATLAVTDALGNAIVSVTYTYVFDNSSRVTKETDTLDNGEIVVKTFVYY